MDGEQQAVLAFRRVQGALSLLHADLVADGRSSEAQTVEEIKRLAFDLSVRLPIRL